MSLGRRVLVTVVDSGGTPLPGAHVALPAIGRAVRTGGDGTAVLAEVPREALSLRAGRDGYEARVTRLEPGDEDATLAVELPPAERPVPPIVAAALELPAGFEQRRRSGRYPSRAFVPQDELARRPDLAVATAVRGPWRRDRLLALAGGAPARAAAQDVRECVPAVLVDGAAPYGWNPLALTRAEAYALEVHAPLEGPLPDVYEGVTGVCGVVAVWTHPPLGVAGDDGRSPARVRLRGRVVDRGDRPVHGARLHVGDAPDTAVADADGRFALEVDEGPHMLQVRRLGLRPASFPIAVVPQDSVEEQVLRLSADTRVNTLSAVRVEGRTAGRPVPEASNLVGFQARRASGIYPRTAFLTAEDFADRQVQDLSEWLARIPGVRLVFQQSRDNRARRQVLVRGGAGPTPYCAPYVYLDGIPYDPNGYLDLVLPTFVAAVEVHHGLAATPPEFQRADNQCGAVLIWSRPR